MWWKFCLLTVYVAFLFMLSRLLETFAYYEGGFISTKLLDPVSLSVRKLKLLLDQRGVSYAGVVEKQELTDLIDRSGDITEGELQAAAAVEETLTTSTNFNGGLHFYEEVEDSKDSVWIVQVVRGPNVTFMVKKDWFLLAQRLKHFGVRTGVFDCSRDKRLCQQKNWGSPRLIMAIPKGFRAKDSVVMPSYMNSSRLPHVFEWISSHLALRITKIKSHSQLNSDWLSFNSGAHSPQVHVIFMSCLPLPPLFLSVLSVKFTGRVKFASVHCVSKQKLRQHLLNSTNVSTHEHFHNRRPRYIIATPEGYYVYGNRKGEYLNYNSMALFLRTLHPEVNDIFLLSLVAVNVMCFLELSLVPGSVLKRLGSLLWHISKWNFLLILLWLPTIGIFQLPYTEEVLRMFLMLLRFLSVTVVGSELRSAWLWYSTLSAPFLLSTFLVYSLCLGICHHFYQRLLGIDSNNNQSDRWQVSWDWYMRALFHPVTSFAQNNSPLSDSDIEVGMELLIERLAMPNFWLRPMIALDYLKELPVWKYSGIGIDSDISSDVDSQGGYGSNVQSDAEDGGACSGTESVCSSSSVRSTSSAELPLLFMCERCRELREQVLGTKSLEELEQQRIESESACAKYLMDGDYRCQCHQQNKSHWRKVKTSKRSQSQQRSSRHNSEPSQDHGLSESDMPAGMLPLTECAICLEHYRYGAVLCGLPCGHSFHQLCIMGWLSRDNHCCPVCRWPPYKAKPCSLHSRPD